MMSSLKAPSVHQIIETESPKVHVKIAALQSENESQSARRIPNEHFATSLSRVVPDPICPSFINKFPKTETRRFADSGSLFIDVSFFRGSASDEMKVERLGIILERQVQALSYFQQKNL
jgi:hypothetical protein